MSFRTLLCSVLVSFAATVPALAQLQDTVKPGALPSFDARDLLDAASPGSPPALQPGLLATRRARSGAFPLAGQTAADAGTRILRGRHGVPRLYLRDGRALTPPSSEPPEVIARAFLRRHSALFDFSAREVDALRLVLRDVSSRASFLTFMQTVDGVDVFEAQVKFTLSASGEVVQVAAGSVAPGLSLSTTPRLSPLDAVRAAFRAAGHPTVPNLVATAPHSPKSSFPNPLGPSFNPITAELNVFPLTADSARLAWRVFLEVDATSYFEILVDAADGRLLYRRNLYVNAAQGRVWSQSPLVGSRQLVSFPPASQPFPDPWLPTSPNGAGGAGWLTQGNNVDSYLDANGDAVPDSSPGAASSLQDGRAYSATASFDYSSYPGLNPRNFPAAAVTNIFYFVNLAHDYYYRLGFDEAAGNFQADNFDRGGAAGDAILAGAHDARMANNAAIAITPEGTAPRLRTGLFLHGTSTLEDDRDAALDGQVIFHEYAHGVSSRLVGGGTSTSCLTRIQSGALGEGWSDYFAISFFDNPVVGAYLGWDTTKGIRRQSYEGYSLTYEDLGITGYEVHDDGELWAATLWDVRSALGGSTTDKLVLAGLKATPCHPSMTDARDAILSADLALNGGANRATLWRVFAKHGLGASARGIDGNFLGTIYDAAFDQPSDLQSAKNPAITSDPLPIEVAMGGDYAYQIAATNPNAGTLNFELSSAPSGMSLVPSTGAIAWKAGFTTQRVKITVTDGLGGRVVHGYLLPVVTPLADGVPITVEGTRFSTGVATAIVAPATQVLRVQLGSGIGNSNLLVTDPDGLSSASSRTFGTETLTFANPAPGLWRIQVYGVDSYRYTPLSVAAVKPLPLATDTVLTGQSDLRSNESIRVFSIPAGTPVLTIATYGGSGDVDLFLRKDFPAVCQPYILVAAPCLFDWSSYETGNKESIRLFNPEPGDYYLDLSAFDNYQGVTLVTSTSLVSIALPATLPDGVVGNAYALLLSSAGGPPPHRWSVAPDALPAGLSLSPNGGIYGTPTKPGSYTFTLRVSDVIGASATAQFKLNILPAGSLAVATNAALPAAFIGTQYSLAFEATGGAPPYTWSLASGDIPAGFVLSAAGVLSGIASTPADATFTVQAADTAGATASRTFSLRAAAGRSLITTFAGDGQFDFSGDGGPATAATLRFPRGLALDAAGNLYIADQNNHRIRMVLPSGMIKTVAGTGEAGYGGDDGPGINAKLNMPSAVVLDQAGNLYIADAGNHVIRWLAADGVIRTLAGTGLSGSSGDGGPASAAQFNYPTALAFDPSGNLYVSDQRNHRIRRITPTGTITTVAGTGVEGDSGDGGPATAAQLRRPNGVAADASGNFYFSDYARIRRVAPNGIVTTFAGVGQPGVSGDSGAATSAWIRNPADLAFDSTGSLFFVDEYGSAVRRVSPSGIISTVAGTAVDGYSGDGGSAALAQLRRPRGLTVTPSGHLLIGDSENNRVRLVQLAGPSLVLTVTTESLPLGSTGLPYSLPFSATGGAAPYTWAVSSGPLPPGLDLSTGGLLSGSPTHVGSFSFTVAVKDKSGASATASFTLAVSAGPLRLSANFPVATMGKPYTARPSASGGAPPYTWSVTRDPFLGGLPAGLAIDAATGVISGTPTARGSANFYLKVEDSAGTSRSLIASIYIQ